MKLQKKKPQIQDMQEVTRDYQGLAAMFGTLLPGPYQPTRSHSAGSDGLNVDNMLLKRETSLGSRCSGVNLPEPLEMMGTGILTNGALAMDIPHPLRFDNVIKIFVTKQLPDYSNPWMTMGVSNGTGSGVVIQTAHDEICILTAAHVVANHTFIQVQKVGEAHQDPNKYVASVLAISHDCDLALLKVSDEDFWVGLSPTTIGQLPALRSVVLVAGFPVGGEQLSITEGVVSRIEGQEYIYSDRTLLAMTVDAAVGSGNSGGPVFNVMGEVVGITFQVRQYGPMGGNDSNGHVIPTPVLRHFLDGIAQAEPEEYKGVPQLGLEVQELTNRNLRKHFDLDKSVSGVLVTKVWFQSSCDGVIQPHDVLTHINDHPIANNETVVLQDCGRVKLPIVFQMSQCGDNVSFGVIRHGKKITLHVTAKPDECLVARSSHDRWPEYFVYCGLVFQRLSNKFIDQVTPGFPHYERLVDGGKLMSKDWVQVIILSRVLSDEVNAGYEYLRLEQIKKFNGEPVPDFKTLVERIQNFSSPYFRLETCCGEQIILPSPKNPEAVESNKRIMENYHIGANMQIEQA